MEKITALLLAALCLICAACTRGVSDDTYVLSAPVFSAEPTPASESIPAGRPETEPVWSSGDGVTISLLQSDFPENIQHLTLVLENAGSRELSFSADYSCEKYTDGSWTAIPWDGPVYDRSLRTVRPHSAGELVLDLTFLVEPLGEGMYRFTGSPLWLGQDEPLSPWQVILRVSPDARAEPDYALYISARPIPTVKGCLVLDRLPVLFVNTTGRDGQVVDIPHLERLEADGEWEEVPYACHVGFCGTPSRLPAEGREWSEDVSFLWGTLVDGRYRLSYDVSLGDNAGPLISGEFSLYTPENNQGLPLA